MVRAANAKKTPEERKRQAAKAARVRWKGNGLTRDQARVLRKLERFETVSISVPANAGGTRISVAIQILESRDLVADVTLALGFARYSRGPKWRPGMGK